jgi:hypothetical protein
MMYFDIKEIETIMEALEPKIKSSLRQTGKGDREDLEQELCAIIIKKLKGNSLQEVPGFFELFEKEKISL